MTHRFASQTSAVQTSNGSFLAPWILRNGHAQTLAGMYIHGPRSNRRLDFSGDLTTGQIALDDGDLLVYHDQRPAEWQVGDRIAVLLHGLGGSHASPYMMRLARLLTQRKIRAIRLDWRGCGAGAALARYPYHSGRSEDLAAALQLIHRQNPGSALSVIGFSLGGNVALKYCGQGAASHKTLDAVDRVVAVCPPIDLRMTVAALSAGWGRLYDRYFCRSCLLDVRHRRRQRPDTVVPENWFSRPPKTLFEFDDTFTAPVCGFASANDYYARASANQFLPAISRQTKIIAAQDDPLIPYEQFQRAAYSSATKLVAPRHGGHLGFCTLAGQKWLDQQILDWAG